MTGAGAEAYGSAADGLGDGGPFPLGVAWDVDPPAEGDGAGGDRLRQAGLASADDAGEQGVGVGQHTFGVQGPGVVAEPATGPGVLADVDAVRAETGFGEEGVGAGDDVGGATVCG